MPICSDELLRWNWSMRNLGFGVLGRFFTQAETVLLSLWENAESNLRCSPKFFHKRFWSRTHPESKNGKCGTAAAGTRGSGRWEQSIARGGRWGWRTVQWWSSSARTPRAGRRWGRQPQFASNKTHVATNGKQITFVQTFVHFKTEFESSINSQYKAWV